MPDEPAKLPDQLPARGGVRIKRILAFGDAVTSVDWTGASLIAATIFFACWGSVKFLTTDRPTISDYPVFVPAFVLFAIYQFYKPSAALLDLVRFLDAIDKNMIAFVLAILCSCGFFVLFVQAKDAGQRSDFLTIGIAFLSFAGGLQIGPRISKPKVADDPEEES